MNRAISLIAIAAVLLFTSCSSKFSQFSSDKTEVKIPEKVNFTAMSKTGDEYHWDFGDGEISTERNPQHRFVKSGQRTVSLTVKKSNKSSTTQMKMNINPTDQCLIEIQTEFGNMLVRLYDETPLHRDNMIKLIESGFYNDLLFHRVINGFMIQGGDPESRNAPASKQLGGGGPSYTIPAEFNPHLVHKKGAIAAARTGDAVNPEKRSSGSQFYIVQGTKQSESGLRRIEDQKGIKYSAEQLKALTEQGGTPFLDQEYTVFGEVIEGLEVIDKIAATQTGKSDRPVKDVKMRIVSIH
ncbi:MAG: peptidylprolyl isomerase [Saprospiraceae bacterium]|jgi:cyclophilin family peptidyl-prolyl cis-trans isomerase|nr:peptidylprolyl isomerase [Saprospiraceae bacterium]MBK7795836.1 peptidylprolyl isomerase [Saprospiraceae bacterium]MBK9379366.1 peptidylprolyl isomerase [Saprospiraceae bacterium]MBL0260947.1 peptidylprolyl isomerase [Saprospiraceae bacterium]